jgi:DNA-binding response OmpR family regulator
MVAERKILVVDDDSELRRVLAEQLEMYEFSVGQAERAGAALELSKRDLFGAILLDVNLADINGHELCRLLRRSGIRAPILMMTGAPSDADAILCFECGASDYIRKPFRFSVLLARLRAQLRLNEQDETAHSIDRFAFRPSGRVLLDADARKEVELTARETELLKYLYRLRGRSVGRETLLRDVWGYSPDAATHTVEQAVYRLRKKLELDPSHPQILVRDGEGYRLMP